jgi:ATP-dependent RNA helicase DHX8/PRP22
MDSQELKDVIIAARKEYYIHKDSEEKEKEKEKEKDNRRDKKPIEDRRNADDIKIGVTQPRRMAAISMAKRLCFERDV